MSNIEYIKNVTSAITFSATVPEWDVNITGMPSIIPDVCIIRSISFNGSAVDTWSYIIWSSLTNDYIGSFNGGSITTSCPQSMIKITSPVPNTIHFKLYSPVGATVSAMQPMGTMTGELIICMEFIKYKSS